MIQKLTNIILSMLFFPQSSWNIQWWQKWPFWGYDSFYQLLDALDRNVLPKGRTGYLNRLPEQNENAKPFAETLLRTARWQQQSIKPSAEPFWDWGPVWLHRSQSMTLALSRNRKQLCLTHTPIACLLAGLAFLGRMHTSTLPIRKQFRNDLVSLSHL